MRLTDSGPDVTFLLESRNKFLRFTNIQQAVATLCNSKLQLIITQALICRLYDMSKLTNAYRFLPRLCLTTAFFSKPDALFFSLTATPTASCWRRPTAPCASASARV